MKICVDDGGDDLLEVVQFMFRYGWIDDNRNDCNRRNQICNLAFLENNTPTVLGQILNGHQQFED